MAYNELFTLLVMCYFKLRLGAVIVKPLIYKIDLIKTSK